MSTLLGTIVSFDPTRSVGLIQLTGSIDAVPFHECDILNRSAFHARLVGRSVRFEVIHNGSSYQAVRLTIIPWWRSAPRDWLIVVIIPLIVWGAVTFGSKEVGWPVLTSYLVVTNFLCAIMVRHLSRQWHDQRPRPTHGALVVLALAGGAAGAFFALLFDARKHFSAKMRVFFIVAALLQAGWIATTYNPELRRKLSPRALQHKAFFETVRIK